jgi:hypothetical protein
MGPHRACFEEFAESLTPEESAAIRYWLDKMGHLFIREFQMDGTVPPGATFQQMEARERYFSQALAKAVICTKTVFRGLSAGGVTELTSDSMNFLRRLICGPEETIFPSHASASLSEEMAREFCNLDPKDEKRSLAVLLRIQPRTARYLAPFTHTTMDEKDVVLLKDTRYRRTSRRPMPDPKPELEYWEVELVEEGGDPIA